jgi:hypothetical protein
MWHSFRKDWTSLMTTVLVYLYPSVASSSQPFFYIIFKVEAGHVGYGWSDVGVGIGFVEKRAVQHERASHIYMPSDWPKCGGLIVSKQESPSTIHD